MNAPSIRSQKNGRRERPSFRPVLETLESRVVPSAAQVSAAFNQLPTDMNNLQGTLAGRPPDVNAINTNLGVVINDMFLLKTGAPGFVTGDRLQIDTALLTDGLQLLYGGFSNYPFIPATQFINVLDVGAGAIEAGFSDILLAGFFPETSGDSVLT